MRVGIQQGTRKLIEATKNNLESMAGLLSSRVFDRLSIETAKLKVSDNAIKTGALNEIKTQKRDLSGRIKRFQFERFQQIIERERNRLQNKLVRFAHNWNDGMLELWPPARSAHAYASERMMGLKKTKLKAHIIALIFFF